VFFFWVIVFLLGDWDLGVFFLFRRVVMFWFVWSLGYLFCGGGVSWGGGYEGASVALFRWGVFVLFFFLFICGLCVCFFIWLGGVFSSLLGFGGFAGCWGGFWCGGGGGLFSILLGRVWCGGFGGGGVFPFLFFVFF